MTLIYETYDSPGVEARLLGITFGSDRQVGLVWTGPSQAVRLARLAQQKLEQDNLEELKPEHPFFSAGYATL